MKDFSFKNLLSCFKAAFKYVLKLVSVSNYPFVIILRFIEQINFIALNTYLMAI